jgi:hypothetical protein
MKRYAIAFRALLVTMAILVVTAESRQKRKEPVVPKKKIVLWNGRDFTGWKLFVEDPRHDVTKTWSVKGGVIRCKGLPAGYIRTEADYTNYNLHIEWRWPEEAGNSGVLLHMSGPDKVWPKSIECQLYSGNAGDFWLIGGVETKEHAGKGKRVQGRRVIKLKESSEKPIGEWNVYEIICKNDWIVVLVNGILQNVATRASVASGKICLQSEGRPIEFRNVYIEPVE